MSTAQLSPQTSVPLDPPTPSGRARTGLVKVEPPYDEQIAEIARRLQRRYPTEQISPADLEGRVRGFYHQFDAARIRTFVAVFVERLVRRSIEQQPVPEPSTVARAR